MDRLFLAQIKMARLEIARIRFFNKYINLQNYSGGADTELNHEQQLEYSNLQYQVTEFEEELLGNPLYFDSLILWMVDIIGLSESSDDSLHQDVKVFLKENSFVVGDSGMGMGSWQLGVACNDVDSRKLCLLLHEKFKLEVTAQELKILRRYWRPKLPLLLSDDQVEAFVRANPQYFEEDQLS